MYNFLEPNASKLFAFRLILAYLTVKTWTSFLNLNVFWSLVWVNYLCEWLNLLEVVFGAVLCKKSVFRFSYDLSTSTGNPYGIFARRGLLCVLDDSSLHASAVSIFLVARFHFQLTQSALAVHEHHRVAQYNLGCDLDKEQTYACDAVKWRHASTLETRSILDTSALDFFELLLMVYVYG